MNPKRSIGISAALIVLTAAGCSGPRPLDDTKAKESYSLGYRFGENMKFQGTEIDLEVYMAGLRDALEGTDPRLSEEEMRATIAELQQRLSSAQQANQREQAEKNLAEGNAFLEENAKKEGVITLESGLQYRVIEEGTGDTPEATDTVSVHYRGTLIDGTEFDSSYQRNQPATFRVDGVIAGWTEALQLMKEGAKWELFIPNHLAYGERGRPPVIPPASVLIFEVELISVQ